MNKVICSRRFWFLPVRSGLVSNIKLATISLQKSQYGPEHHHEAIKDIRDGVIHAVLLQKRLFVSV